MADETTDFTTGGTAESYKKHINAGASSYLDVPVDHFVPSQASMQHVGRQIQTDRVPTGLLTTRSMFD